MNGAVHPPAPDQVRSGSTPRPAAGRWHLALPLARPTFWLPAIAQPPRWVPAADVGPAGNGRAPSVAPDVSHPAPDVSHPAPAVDVAARAVDVASAPVLARPPEALVGRGVEADEDVEADAAPRSVETVDDVELVGPLEPVELVSTVDAEAGSAGTNANTRAVAVAVKPAVEPARPATHGVLEWIGIVAGALIVALVIKLLLIQAFVIPSRSMETTLQIGDRVLVLKPAYWLGEIDRGDVVVFDRPPELRDGTDNSDLIKRVVGLPGEQIEGRDGRVLIDGVPLDEPYLGDDVETDRFGPLDIPQGMVFVMGDNRDNSRDSRVFGPLDEDMIVGRAFVRWWPPTRMSGL